MDNKEWSEKILKKIDPSFRHRWELFDEQIQQHLSLKNIWLDLGCADNAAVAEFSANAKYAVGVDIIRLPDVHKPFVQADIRHLPFFSRSINLITLRFVVEHFSARQKYFDELHRVLQMNGRVILVTTNIWSPFIFLPRMLLPYKIKHWLLTHIFQVQDEDIFPTFHKVNSKSAIKKIEGFRVVRFDYISDLNYTRKWMFLIFLFLHLISRLPGLSFLRTNILAVLEKTD